MLSSFECQSPPQFQCSKTIIHIFLPNNVILKASALSTATTKDIKQLIHEEDVIFIHNGIEMDDTMPLSYYDVKDKDILFVCPKSKSPISEKWANLSKDPDLVREKFGAIIDPTTSRKALFKDFQMLKMEMKPRIYRKLCSKFIGEETNKRISEEQKRKHVTIVPKPINFKDSKPASEPLPVFWNTSERLVE